MFTNLTYPGASSLLGGIVRSRTTLDVGPDSETERLGSCFTIGANG